jgi:hypothetical protein
MDSPRGGRLFATGLVNRDAPPDQKWVYLLPNPAQHYSSSQLYYRKKPRDSKVIEAQIVSLVGGARRSS